MKVDALDQLDHRRRQPLQPIARIVGPALTSDPILEILQLGFRKSLLPLLPFGSLVIRGNPV